MENGYYEVDSVQYADDMTYFANGTVVKPGCEDGFVPTEDTITCRPNLYWDTFTCIDASK